MLRWKRLLSLLLCLVMVLSFFPTALAEGEIKEEIEPDEDSNISEKDDVEDAEDWDEAQGNDQNVLIPDGSYVEGSNVYSVFIPDEPMTSGRYEVTNTKNATGADIVNEARKWAGKGATYWSGTDPWIKSIAWRTGYTTDGQTSFDCSGFVGRILNDVGFRGTSYTPSYGSGHVLIQNYGTGYIGISIEELVNYGTNIDAEVAKAKNGDYSGLQPGDIIGWTSGSLGRHVIIYAGLNSNGKPSMVEFTGSGYYEREITASYQNAFQYGARLTSASASYIDKCTSYPTYGTVRMSKACNPYTLPCNAETAKKYNCTSTALTNKALKAGDTVVVTGIVYNTEKHYWYKVDLDKNGSVAYVYADNANISSFSYECPWVYNSSFPSTITGATWLSGSILTGGSELVSIQGMVLNGDTTDISKRSNVYNSSAISCSGTSYSLKGSAVDTGLAFQNLAEGQYYTLIYQVKVKHYKLTSATAISSAETHTYICKDKCFYRAAAGAHVHDKGTYMYYWSSHPHYKCYKCSSCGTIWEDRNETVQLPNCESCRPGKPAFIGLEGTHLANEPVVFSWNETDRTTHYNIWVYKQNTSGEYVAVDHTFYVNSGYELALEPGRYKALVQAYNSNLWESDNSDWVHTESDPTYFIVEQVTYTITYNANGGTGAPAAQTKTHDVALTLSSTKPTRANASAGSYTVTLNANGGSVSTDKLTAARTTSYSFKNWNTAANGNGTSYNPGATYTANAAATLYAQWNSSTTTAAVTLPTPTRTGYTFMGWATSTSATSGTTGSYTPSGNVTLYAIWKQDQTTDGTLSLGTARGSAGSEVVLEVKLDKNPGIMMLSFRLDYDKSKLQFLGGEDGSLTGWTFSTTGSGALWDGDKDYKATGTIVKLRFKILDNAKEGDVVVNFTAVEAWNYSEREILFGANAGKVTISNRIPGDVTAGTVWRSTCPTRT